MLDLRCGETKLELDYSGERLSMLIVGGSRMGKTYFMSLLGESLIRSGEAIHLVDLGDKWSVEDRKRIALPKKLPETDIMKIYFPTKDSLLGSAKYIANALGHSSGEVICVIRIALERVISRRKGRCFISEFLYELELEAKQDANAGKVFDKLDSFECVPKVELLIDVRQSEEMAYNSTLWDLSGYETNYINVLFQLIAVSLLSVQRLKFRRQEPTKKVFVIVDEFQNLNCTQQSIVGKCLTEGQKYKMYMILATQFLQGKFSEAVINQFKQGGFQMYFRLTEEEAERISKQFAYNKEEQREWAKILRTLKQGQFILKGSHRVNGRTDITERLRIVDIIDERSAENKQQRKKCTVAANGPRGNMQQIVKVKRMRVMPNRSRNVIGCYEKSIGGKTIWRKDVYTTQQPK